MRQSKNTGMILFSVHIRKEVHDALCTLVQQGVFPNVSEAVRTLIILGLVMLKRGEWQ